MSERQPITYADARSDLPQSDFSKRLAELRIARTFEAANNNRTSLPQAQIHATEKIDGRARSAAPRTAAEPPLCR